MSVNCHLLSRYSFSVDCFVSCAIINRPMAYIHICMVYMLYWYVHISRFYCKTKMRNTRRKQFGANHTLFKSANDNRNSGILKPSDKISKLGYTSIWYFKELWNISFIFCQICIARLYIIFWVFIRDFFASSECVFMFFLHVWKLVTLSGMDFRSVSYKVLGWPFWQWLFQLIFIKSVRNIFHSWVFVSVRVVWAYKEFIELSDKRRQTIYILHSGFYVDTSDVNCQLWIVQSSALFLINHLC